MTMIIEESELLNRELVDLLVTSVRKENEVNDMFSLPLTASYTEVLFSLLDFITCLLATRGRSFQEIYC